MAQITLIHADSGACAPVQAEMICTDPPYDMPGDELASIIARHAARHLLLITTMRQLLEFVRAAPQWRLSFDAVLDCVVPKQSKSALQPNYVHQTVCYFVHGRAGSVFSRRRNQRSDVAEGNGYWPTIIRATRQDMGRVRYGKSVQAMTDLLGAFAVNSVLDPFAGGGSTGIAAMELGIHATLIERDDAQFAEMSGYFSFLGVK